MTETIVVTLDQLRRAHPGGIGTYARGLVSGLLELRASDEFDASLIGLAPAPPRRPDPLDELGIDVATVSTGVDLTTRLWRYVASGVSADASVVHATSLAGPFRGGRRDAVHSVAVQDLLWRDHPELTTRRGARFHERRIAHAKSCADVRVIVTSRGVGERLVADGFDAERVFVVRLGVDRELSADAAAQSRAALQRLGASGVEPFAYTLAVGTVQPRKNITRLASAHAEARRRQPGIGPLLIAGARGWGEVDTAGATVLGEVDQRNLAGLIAGCRVMAYVPIAEGWGLPPIEALAAGRPVVASAVPSVEGNAEVFVVDPLDVDAIAAGLVAAGDTVDSDEARSHRRASVSELTWANSARDHLAAWR